MDAVKKMLLIISPWTSTVKRLTAESGFIDRNDVIKLRDYAYYTARFPAWYDMMCNVNNYHQALRAVLKMPDSLGLLVKSGADWKNLERLLSLAVDAMLYQSAVYLASGRDILDLVEKMDLMEQLDCTIGDLTEEKMNELRSRALSQRDAEVVGSLQVILDQIVALARVNNTLVASMNVQTGKFNREFRASALPMMERLYKTTTADPCTHPYCNARLSDIQATLNTLLHYRRVDVSAAALNDLQVALSTYLESTLSQMAGMRDNLAVLVFAVQFKGVVDGWQTVDGLLQATKKALQ